MPSANLGESLRVVIATDREVLRDQLRQQMLGMGFECGAADCVAHAALPVRLAQETDLVLVGTSGAEEDVLAALKYASKHGAGLVLAVGAAQDAKLILQAQRSGAREYIDQGRLEEELPLALERLRQAGAMKLRQGRTVAVVSANPGAGVTTVASTLAFALAEKHPRRVALAELGPGVPELSLDLDLTPTHSVEELVSDWERMDARMLQQTLVEHPAGVQVLASAPEALAPAAVSQQAMRRTVLLLRSMFDFTVLDLGHSLSDAALEAMAVAEAVVLVARLDVPSLRLARRFLRQLVERGVSEQKLRVAANRYGQRGLVGWKKVEQALGVSVQVWIPDDPATVNDALNKGKPLVQTAQRAKITRRISQLAQELNGQAS
jgi:pilus assembly protein CpaE